MAILHSLLVHFLVLFSVLKDGALVVAFELDTPLPHGIDASVGAELHIAHELDRKALIPRCPQDSSSPNCSPDPNQNSNQPDNTNTQSGNSSPQPDNNTSTSNSDSTQGQSSSDNSSPQPDNNASTSNSDSTQGQSSSDNSSPQPDNNASTSNSDSTQGQTSSDSTTNQGQSDSNSNSEVPPDQNTSSSETSQDQNTSSSDNNQDQNSSSSETPSNESPGDTSGPTPQPVTGGLAEGWYYKYCATDDQNMRALDHHAPNLWEPNREQWLVEDCVNYCNDQQYVIAGLEWAGQCYCGNQVNPDSTQVAESDCSDPCISGSEEACGNDNRLSLYAVDGAPLPESSVGQPLYAASTTTTSYPEATTTPAGEYDYEMPVQDYTPSFDPPEADSDYIQHDGEVMTNNREGTYQYQVLIDADTTGDDVPLTDEYTSLDTSSFLKCTDVCNSWNEAHGSSVACEAVAYYGPGACYLLTNLSPGEDGKYSYYSAGGILGLVLRTPSYPEPREGVTEPPADQGGDYTATITTTGTTEYSAITTTTSTKSYEPWSIETIYPTAPGGKRTVNVYYSACPTVT